MESISRCASTGRGKIQNHIHSSLLCVCVLYNWNPVGYLWPCFTRVAVVIARRPPVRDSVVYPIPMAHAIHLFIYSCARCVARPLFFICVVSDDNDIISCTANETSTPVALPMAPTDLLFRSDVISAIRYFRFEKIHKSHRQSAVDLPFNEANTVTNSKEKW